MKKLHSILLGGLLLTGLTVVALAQPGHHRGGNPLDRLQSQLSLTPEQVQRLQPTFEAMKQKHQAQRDQMKSKLNALLTPEQRAKMEASGEHRRGGMRDLNLSDEQKAGMKSFWESNKAQMQQERAQIDAQMQATLTPEQLAKFQEMKTKMGEKGQRRHHREGGCDKS